MRNKRRWNWIEIDDLFLVCRYEARDKLTLTNEKMSWLNCGKYKNPKQENHVLSVGFSCPTQSHVFTLWSTVSNQVMERLEQLPSPSHKLRSHELSPISTFFNVIRDPMLAAQVIIDTQPPSDTSRSSQSSFALSGIRGQLLSPVFRLRTFHVFIRYNLDCGDVSYSYPLLCSQKAFCCFMVYKMVRYCLEYSCRDRIFSYFASPDLKLCTV